MCDNCIYCKVSPNPLMFENSLTDKREILYNITCEKQNKILMISIKYYSLKNYLFCKNNFYCVYYIEYSKKEVINAP
jgi:hypothetical protein